MAKKENILGQQTPNQEQARGKDTEVTMIDSMQGSAEEKKARMIKATTILQAKVGLGPLDEKLLERAKDVMENNKVDFAPLAKEYLSQLYDVMKRVHAGELSRDAAVEAMNAPVMQLKAHASMFRYTLIGQLANIMMSFLESVSVIDDDVVEIVEAHHRTLKTIVIKKMEGDGGPAGEQLKAELNDAVKRYRGHKK